MIKFNFLSGGNTLLHLAVNTHIQRNKTQSYANTPTHAHTFTAKHRHTTAKHIFSQLSTVSSILCDHTLQMVEMRKKLTFHLKSWIFSFFEHFSPSFASVSLSFAATRLPQLCLAEVSLGAQLPCSSSLGFTSLIFAPRFAAFSTSFSSWIVFRAQ